MSPRTPAPCPHENRPGITVCLRCRQEARAAAGARRRRLFVRAAVIVIIAGVSAAAAISGATALQGGRRAAAFRDTMLAASTQESSPNGRSGVDTSEAVPTRDSARGLVGFASPVHPDAAPASVPAAKSVGSMPKSSIAPVINQGRTEVQDGIFAVREGDEITVHFDTPLSRTRRRDKLEQVVRTTLPVAFGPAIDSLLSALPAGKLVSADNLTSALSSQEFRVALSGGWTLALRPGTRPGQDGPLVVSYRASVTR